MNLDDQKIYAKLDNGQVAKSIEMLPEQVKQVLADADLIKVPKDYSQIENVVLNGMGGSNLGAQIIKTVLADELKVPFNIEPGYGVPAYVNNKTLFVISSYSGTTEEPLSVYKEVKKRGAKVIAITEHNEKSQLYKLMYKDDIPGYIFKPEKNPSHQPRLGVGYTIFGSMTLLAKAGLFSLKKEKIAQIIKQLEIWGASLKPETLTKNNIAKKIAENISGRMVVLAGAEFLAGNLHAMRNQVNECSKQFMSYLVVPDMNHYAMEGLVNPEENREDMIFLFIDSKLYHKRNQTRMQLTKQVVKKNGINIVSQELKATTKLGQAFEMLQLGAWVSYYLGILNNVDPAKIPYVDWFKAQLKLI